MSDLYSVTLNNEDIIMQVSDIDFGTVVIGGTQMAQVSETKKPTAIAVGF